MAAPVQKARVSSSSSISCPPIYVTHATKTPQDTPRSSHAHISHSDRAHSMSSMPSPYQEMVTSPYPSPVPTPTSGYHEDGPVGHTRHNGVMQAAVGRESPSSFLFLQPADGISTMKPAQWQRRQDTQKQYGDSNDYKNGYPYSEAFESSGGYDESSMHRKSSEYAWGYAHATNAGPMELDSHSEHKRESSASPVSTHDDRTNHAAYQYPPLKLAHSPSAYSDYSSDYHHHAKSFYGYQDHDMRQRIWGTSEATPVTSAATFKTRRYTSMPSPPHSQGRPSSPLATKSMEEQLSVPRTLPLSPASVPEIIVHSSLQRSSSEMQSQDHGSAYNPDSLPATMDFTRTYNPAYTTRNSPIDL